MSYANLKTPGVYVKEISIFPPSVAQVPTAIPAFVGYTQKHHDEKGDSLRDKPYKISSMLEFTQHFGGPPPLVFDAAGGHAIELDTATNQVVKASNRQSYYLYDSMQLFFANGGGDCYIVAVDTYRGDGVVDYTAMAQGLAVLDEVDEPTMLVFPDAVSMGNDLYKLQQDALRQCGSLMDRVGVFDLHRAETKAQHDGVVTAFRDRIGMSQLKYGAAYTPWLKVGVQKNARYADIKGHVVKAGSSVAIDLSTLVQGFSTADTATIQNLLTALDELTDDNALMAAQVTQFLDPANAQFANYAPAGFSPGTPLPSLVEGFELLRQSAQNLIAAAEANPSDANVHAANLEIIKMLRQVYNVVYIIDNISSTQPGLMQHAPLLAHTWTQLGFTQPFSATLGDTQEALEPGLFDDMITLLSQWDGTLTNVALQAISPTPSTPTMFARQVISGPIPNTFGALDTVFPLETPASTPALLAVAAPANNGHRLANQQVAVGALSNLFTFFAGIISSAQAFGQSLERATEQSLKATWPLYKNLIDTVNKSLSVLPPSGAVAGIYARVDNERGVWKAPANVSVTYAEGTLVNITDAMQASLNVDVNTGKSVNAIRVFSGKGTMVWGARTLAGNDNEWRYVPVRRFFNMVEESVKKATHWVVFEPNDANTWVKVKSMIENFLVLQWRAGALAGAKPDEAFFVKVGLNQTMSFTDILEGRLIVQIGMAVVRPAEFIILEFSHKVQTS